METAALGGSAGTQETRSAVGRWGEGSCDTDRCGRCVATMEGHGGGVNAVAVLGPDRLASGLYDKTIKVWEVAAARCVATLEGHQDWVLSLAVLGPDRLASGSADKTIKVWSPR